MGYPTFFDGDFELNRPLAEEHKAFLIRFSQTCRLIRDATMTAVRSDPQREAVGLPVGPEGAYFVGGPVLCRLHWEAPDVIGPNKTPAGPLTHWCGWVPNEDGAAIVWNDNEKFFMYLEWLRYLIEHFLGPWGYVLTGRVDWRGGGWDDVGMIIAVDNSVTAYCLADFAPLLAYATRLGGSADIIT